MASSGVSLSKDYFTLELEILGDAGAYQVALSHTDPRSQAKSDPAVGSLSFEIAELRENQLLPDDYGAALSRQLFADDNIRERFGRVEAMAHSAELDLRVVLRIGPSAVELESLRWELLRHPQRDEALAFTERVLLSRFLASDNMRPVRPLARDRLRALVAVAAPADEALRRMKLAPVDVAAELELVRDSLAGIELRELGTADAPCTLDALSEALREGVDLLYFIGHGKYARSSSVFTVMFPDADGGLDRVDGDRFVHPFRDHPPRLVVLATCQSAGDGQPVAVDERPSVHATLASRLAHAGVTALVAMQGNISVDTVRAMYPTFFRELLRDGQIDRALAVARQKVATRHDAWMSALYCRLVDGRLFSSEAAADGGADGLVEVAAERFAKIAVYKQLHDTFHRIELTSAALLGSADDGEVQLDIVVDDFEIAVAQIERIVSERADDLDPVLVERIKRRVQSTRAALEGALEGFLAADSEAARVQAVGRAKLGVAKLLGKVPTQLDEKIRGVAEALELDSQLSALAGLDEVRAEIERRVLEHGRLQDIDSGLRVSSPGPDEWDEVALIVPLLEPPASETLARHLARILARTTKCEELMSGDAPAEDKRDALHLYHQYIVSVFSGVDVELKARLTKLADPRTLGEELR